MWKKVTSIVCALVAVAAMSDRASAVLYEGIDFPQGAASFADLVLFFDNTGNTDFPPGYSPDGVPTRASRLDPDNSLGEPDFITGLPDPTFDTGAVSIGRGGRLDVLFSDNVLTNSDTTDDDLHIFERGDDIEDTFVYIRPTNATAALLAVAPGSYIAVGLITGSTSSIDIDLYLPSAAAGTYKFNAVRLIDDPNEGNTGPGPTVGADIDAIGAISTQQVNPLPEPVNAVLVMLGLSAAAIKSFSRRRSA